MPCIIDLRLILPTVRGTQPTQDIRRHTACLERGHQRPPNRIRVAVRRLNVYSGIQSIQRYARDHLMPQSKLKATFMRGGTSKAVVFNREDLPPDPAQWDPIFLSVMGSPDPNGRQLDGMGGGLSSLSKVCVIGAPTRPDADINYTFAQISVKSATVDYSANCGNMSSAMGPFAVSKGLVKAPADGEAVVRIHNTNTGKIIVARFPMTDGEVETEGDMAIDGVGGQGAAVRLEFIDPGGTRTGRLLPTGHSCDVLDVPTLGPIEASLIDAANPCVFVAATSVGKDGSETPEA